VIYAEPVGEIPLNLPAIIGDILQNLRACLDHIAFALSERGYGGPLPDNIAKVCGFPITKCPKKFAGGCPGRGGISGGPPLTDQAAVGKSLTSLASTSPA